MTTSIGATSAVLIAQTHAKQGPERVPHPGKESEAGKAGRTGAASSFTALSDATDPGATTAPDIAQDPPSGAQKAPGDGPGRDPGFQDGNTTFGDVNGDGALDQSDIQALLKAFNRSVTAADLNQDGTVDTADLGLLIRAIRDVNDGGKAKSGPSQSIDPGASLSALPADTDHVTNSKHSGAGDESHLSQTPPNAGEPDNQPGVWGDLDGDGVVSVDDLMMLRKSFGSAGGAGDLNGDGRVDTADLGAMIGLLNQNEES